MKRKVMTALAATVLSLAIGLAWEGAATASTTTSGAVGCSTWATGTWADNCEVSLGSSSNMVLAVQIIVTGACGGNGISIDGIFGSDTQHAVECFQNQHNLSADGIVGPDTWTALQNSLKLDHVDGDWDYYHPSLYIDAGFVEFRKWGPSGRWYVLDASYVPMTS